MDGVAVPTRTGVNADVLPLTCGEAGQDSEGYVIKREFSVEQDR